MERKTLSEVLEKEGIYKKCCELGYKGSLEELSEEVIKTLESKEFSELTADELGKIAGGREGHYSISKRLAAALVSSVVALGVTAPQGHAVEIKQSIGNRLKSKFWSTPKSKIITSGVLAGVPLTVLLGIIAAGGAGVLVSQLVKKNEKEAESSSKSEASSKDLKDTSKDDNSAEIFSQSEGDSHNGSILNKSSSDDHLSNISSKGEKILHGGITPNNEYSGEDQDPYSYNIDDNNLITGLEINCGTMLSGLMDNNDIKKKEILSAQEFPSMAVYEPKVEVKVDNSLVPNKIHSFAEDMHKAETEAISSLDFMNIQAQSGGKENFLNELKSAKRALSGICFSLQHNYKSYKEDNIKNMLIYIKQIVEKNPFLISSKILDKEKYENFFKDSVSDSSLSIEDNIVEVYKLFVDASYTLSAYCRAYDKRFAPEDKSIYDGIDSLLLKFTLLFAEISSKYHHTTIKEGECVKFDPRYLDYAIDMVNYLVENNPRILRGKELRDQLFEIWSTSMRFKEAYVETDSEEKDITHSEESRITRLKMQEFSYVEERDREKNDNVYNKHSENIKKTLENSIESISRTPKLLELVKCSEVIEEVYNSRIDSTRLIGRKIYDLNNDIGEITSQIEIIGNTLNKLTPCVSQINTASETLSNPGLKNVLRVFPEIIKKYITWINVEIDYLKNLKEIYTKKIEDLKILRSNYELGIYGTEEIETNYILLMKKFYEDISKLDITTNHCDRCIIVKDVKTYELFEKFDFLCTIVKNDTIQSSIDNIDSIEKVLTAGEYKNDIQILKNAYENYKQINEKISPNLEKIKFIQQRYFQPPYNEDGSVCIWEKYDRDFILGFTSQIDTILESFKKCDKEIENNTKELGSIANKAKEASEKVLVKGKIELIHKIFKLIDDNKIDLNKIEWKDAYREDIEKLLKSLPTDKFDTNNVTKNGWIGGEGKAFENAAKKRKDILDSIGNNEIRETVKTALEDSKHLARFIKLVITQKTKEWSSKNENNLLWNYNVKSMSMKHISNLYININYIIKLSLLRYAQGYKGTPTLNDLQIKELYELSKNLGTLFDAYDENIIIKNI